MRSKKIVSIILALAMVLGSFSLSFGETTTTSYTDIHGHWGATAINTWSAHGVVQGDQGGFRPDDSITRGEMAVILDNIMGFQSKAENKFADLPPGQFYTDAILKANAAGIILGDGATVRPLDKITREEAALMMSRAFAIKAAQSGTSFTDESMISDWAKGAVLGMEALGYVNGYMNQFNPQSGITRAETVTMINNMVKGYYTEPGTYTGQISGIVIIKVPGVILKDMVITGTLIIAEGVGASNVTLEGTTITGSTIVIGGGTVVEETPEEPIAGGGGGGGTPVVTPIAVGNLTFNEGTLLINGDPVDKDGSTYLINYDWTTTSELSVTATGSGFDATKTYPMYVKVYVNDVLKITFNQTVAGNALNTTRYITNGPEGSNVEGYINDSLNTLLETMFGMWTSAGKNPGDEVKVTIGTTVNTAAKDITTITMRVVTYK